VSPGKMLVGGRMSWACGEDMVRCHVVWRYAPGTGI